jgi:hypothetical protein
MGSLDDYFNHTNKLFYSYAFVEIQKTPYILKKMVFLFGDYSSQIQNITKSIQ